MGTWRTCLTSSDPSFLSSALSMALNCVPVMGADRFRTFSDSTCTTAFPDCNSLGFIHSRTRFMSRLWALNGNLHSSRLSNWTDDTRRVGLTSMAQKKVVKGEGSQWKWDRNEMKEGRERRMQEDVERNWRWRWTWIHGRPCLLRAGNLGRVKRA